MSRPELDLVNDERLSRMERLHVAFVRRSLEPGLLDQALRLCQREIGARWIDLSLRRLQYVIGRERLPELDPGKSYILVSNHRSFFDLYAVTTYLVRRGMRHRILFPVRSSFFYDSPLGFLVNGAMSFFAMYPPIFRERSKLSLNGASLDELARLLTNGGVFAGMHPEGTRKRDDDPYTLLPAQRGVGRVIHQARVPVIPVFVNGLVNGIAAQIALNRDPDRHPVIMVFGAPVDFSAELARPASPKVDRAIAERALKVVAALGQEEKAARAELLSRVTARG